MKEEVGNIDWAAVITAAAASPLGIIALIIITISIAGYFMLKGTSEYYRFVAFLLLFFGGVALGASLISERDNFITPDKKGVIVTTGVVLASDTTPTRTEERVREQKFGERNAHCASPKDLDWGVNAENGWVIDVTSINVRVTVKSKQSQYIGVNNASSHGFNILGRLINNGDCIRAFGNVIAKDARGSLHVVASFKETRTVIE